MPTELYHLVAFIIALVVVWWSTPIINEFGQRKGLVDKPNQDPDKDTMHERPMVRLGGVSIFAGTVIALILVWILGGFGWLPPNKEWEIWGVTMGGVAFFLIGLTDDLYNLSPMTRLILQTVVASAAWGVGVRIEFLSVPFGNLIQIGLLSLPITVIWLVGMANAINWIDGLDGLAAGGCGISAVVMMVLALFMEQPAAALIAAALAGAAYGVYPGWCGGYWFDESGNYGHGSGNSSIIAFCCVSCANFRYVGGDYFPYCPRKIAVYWG